MQVACASCSDEPQNPYSIGYLWQEAEPNFGKDYTALLQQLKNDRKSNQELEITGKYYQNEVGGLDLGLRRAQILADSLMGRLGLLAKPKVRGQKIWETNLQEDEFFPAAEIQWVAAEPKAPAVKSSRTFYLQQLGKEMALTVDDQNYLNLLAKSLADSEKRVSIIGHTDDKGSAKSNEVAGTKRASFIADQLVRLGISRQRLLITNKLDSQPLVPNSSDANRAKNRRVELEVLQ